MIKPWKLLHNEYVLNTKWIKVRKDQVLLPTGVEIEDFYIVELPKWINVIAITEDGSFVLERQYRHGLQVICYEICAGTVEPGEDSLDCAKRELLEETGYGGGKWSLFMKTAPNPANLTNTSNIYLAEGVKLLTRQQLESTEDIEISLKSKEEVLDLLRNDMIIQGIMSSALWRYMYENN